ncbi:MAG: hypothetical protein JSS02_04075 [Planctomycetes bacterium]|nr:hypothetical protein [Planctomycetota bacterium]
MKCDEALQLMGELEADDNRQSQWRLRLHLLICLHCRRYLASYRTTIRAAKAAYSAPPETESVEEIPDDQVAAILQAARGKSPSV